MKIAIGCDQNAYDFKCEIIKHLESTGNEVIDFGSKKNEDVLYPSVALEVSKEVAAQKFDRAILICGTGIGMSIAANKVTGVRAALCHDVYSAERARKSNNAQIMTMGSQVVGIETAKKIVDAWMSSEYVPGGRSQPKVELVDVIETEYSK